MVSLAHFHHGAPATIRLQGNFDAKLSVLHQEIAEMNLDLS
jgi:hypothetical protein